MRGGRGKGWKGSGEGREGKVKEKRKKVKMEQCAKCFSVNIAGLNNSLKRRKIKTLLMQDQVDILCLWETHMRKAEEKYFKGLFYGSIFHAPAPTKSKGVLI